MTQVHNTLTLGSWVTPAHHDNQKYVLYDPQNENTEPFHTSPEIIYLVFQKVYFSNNFIFFDLLGPNGEYITCRSKNLHLFKPVSDSTSTPKINFNQIASLSCEKILLSQDQATTQLEQGPLVKDQYTRVRATKTLEDSTSTQEIPENLIQILDQNFTPPIVITTLKDQALKQKDQDSLIQMLDDGFLSPNEHVMLYENEEHLLTWATHHHLVRLVGKILSFSVNPNHIISAFGKPLLIELLTSKSPVLNASKEQILTLQTLLDLGIDPNQSHSTSRDTPLIWASLLGFTEVTQIVLDYQPNEDSSLQPVNLSHQNIGGLTALISSIKGANNRINSYNSDLKLSLSYPDLVDLTCQPSSIQAIITTHINILQLLLDRGANPNQTDYKGETPLSWAVKFGLVEMVRLLLDYQPNEDSSLEPVNRNSSNRAGTTPLIHAIQGAYASINEGDLEKYTTILQILLNQGADPNQDDLSRETPLSWAVKFGLVEIVQILLDYQPNEDLFLQAVDLKHQNKDGLTPLMHAIEQDHDTIAKKLIENMSQDGLERKNEKGETAMSLAKAKNKRNIVMYIQNRIISLSKS